MWAPNLHVEGQQGTWMKQVEASIILFGLYTLLPETRKKETLIWSLTLEEYSKEEETPTQKLKLLEDM